MIASGRRNITRVLIIVFVLFLFPSDGIPVQVGEKTGLQLIKQAEKFFKNYKYQESIDKFRDAEKYVKSEKNLSRLYLGISRSYYAMGLMSQVREAINKLALLSVKSSFKKSKYPRGYLKIYNDIQAEIEKKKREELIVKSEEEPESLYQVEKTGEETKEITKKPLAGVIEKPGKKKKKKKSLLLPITLGAVALGAVVMLMGGKSDGGGDTASNTASVHIESAPSGASVFVDGASKGVITPCDINVSAGSHEIKLVIEGWGETSNNNGYDKDTSYTLNAQLAPYKYSPVFSYTMDNSNSPVWNWDCDNSGNVYTTVSNKLDKYDASGNKLFSKNLSFVVNTTKIYIDRTAEKIYFGNWDPGESRSNFDITDLDGNYITNWYNLPSTYIDIDPDGVHYLISGDVVEKYGTASTDFGFLGTIPLEAPHSYRRICLSEDNEHFFIGNRDSEGIYKYSLAGAYVTMWQGFDGYQFKGYCLSQFGTGDQERIFYRTTNGNEYRIVISNGNGEYLTKTSNINYLWYICNDDSGNIYAGTGWNNSKAEITRYEVAAETEGLGTWTADSTASTTSRIGSLGTTRIDPFRSKRSGKPEIDKDRGKRGKKDL